MILSISCWEPHVLNMAVHVPLCSVDLEHFRGLHRSGGTRLRVKVSQTGKGGCGFALTVNPRVHRNT